MSLERPRRNARKLPDPDFYVDLPWSLSPKGQASGNSFDDQLDAIEIAIQADSEYLSPSKKATIKLTPRKSPLKSPKKSQLNTTPLTSPSQKPIITPPPNSSVRKSPRCSPPTLPLIEPTAPLGTNTANTTTVVDTATSVKPKRTYKKRLVLKADDNKPNSNVNDIQYKLKGKLTSPLKKTKGGVVASVKRAALIKSHGSQLKCRVPVCLAGDKVHCFIENNGCARNGTSSRWYHISSSEHYCNRCFENYYRSYNSGHKTYMQWRKLWSSLCQKEPHSKQYAANTLLPYWLQCRDCHKWRSVPRTTNVTPQLIRQYTCGMAPFADKEPITCEDFENKKVGEALDRTWITSLNLVPYMERSPAAPYLQHYYTDGVGMSPSPKSSHDSENVIGDETDNISIISISSSTSRHSPGMEPQELIDGMTTAEEDDQGKIIPDEMDVISISSSLSSPDKSYMREIIDTTKKTDTASYVSSLMSSCDAKHLPKLEKHSPIKSLSSKEQDSKTQIGFFWPFHQPGEALRSHSFSADTMLDFELENFPEFAHLQQMYLGLRNIIVTLWCQNFRKWLTPEFVAERVICRGLGRIRAVQELPRIIAFLTRRGYINAGMLEPPRELQVQPELLPKDNVIVIGAGPSGLSAARQLHRYGVPVTVLEARDRIGGRVWDTDEMKIRVGHGAMIIVGHVNNPITLLCEQLGLETRTIRDKCDLFTEDGALTEPEMDKRIEAHFNSLLDKVAEWRYSQPKLKDADLLSRMNAMHDAYLEETQTTFTEEENLLLQFHVSNLEYACGCELNKASALHWDQNELFPQFTGFHSMIKNGYSTVLERLAEKLDIRKSTEVVRIKHGPDGVTIESSSGKTFTGAKVIVTTPVAILKRGMIEFDPPLPKAKIDIIEAMGAGIIEKVVLEFPTRFWDVKMKGADFFGLVPSSKDRCGLFGVFYDISQQDEQGESMANVLMTWVSGSAIRLIKDKSDAEVVQMCVDVLRKLFSNEEVADPVESFVTRWSRDPHSRMSYSYVPVGSSGEVYDAMAEDVNETIYFAGEATNRQFPQTVTGAYISGIREANKILESCFSPLDRHEVITVKEHIPGKRGRKASLIKVVKMSPLKSSDSNSSIGSVKPVKVEGIEGQLPAPPKAGGKRTSTAWVRAPKSVSAQAKIAPSTPSTTDTVVGRKRKLTKKNLVSCANTVQMGDVTPAKRGRPRKYPLVQQSSQVLAPKEPENGRRGRGRPRKVVTNDDRIAQAVAAASSQQSLMSAFAKPTDSIVIKVTSPEKKSSVIKMEVSPGSMLSSTKKVKSNTHVNAGSSITLKVGSPKSLKFKPKSSLKSPKVRRVNRKTRSSSFCDLTLDEDSSIISNSEMDNVVVVIPDSPGDDTSVNGDKSSDSVWVLESDELHIDKSHEIDNIVVDGKLYRVITNDIDTESDNMDNASVNHKNDEDGQQLNGLDVSNNEFMQSSDSSMDHLNGHMEKSLVGKPNIANAHSTQVSPRTSPWSSPRRASFSPQHLSPAELSDHDYL